MANLIFLLLSVLLAFLVDDSRGSAVGAWYDGTSLQDNVPQFNNLCDCKNGACNCCLAMPTFKACSLMEILEQTDANRRTTFGIRLTISINDQNVASQAFPVSDVPSKCFEMDDMETCIRLAIRREMSNFKLCGWLIYKVNGRMTSKYEISCIDVPTSAVGMNDKKLNEIPLSDSSSFMRLADSFMRSWIMTKGEGDDTPSADPPTPPPGADDNLGRIDRNTNPERKHWDDWNM